MAAPTVQALTERQRRLVEAHMAGHTVTEAMRIAGYASIGAASQALRRPNVRAALEARQAHQPDVMDRQERQRLWTTIARDRKVEMVHRLRASEDLARAGGDFLDRIALMGHDGGPLRMPTSIIFVLGQLPGSDCLTDAGVIDVPRLQAAPPVEVAAWAADQTPAHT